jgi:hypothetical protein
MLSVFSGEGNNQWEMRPSLSEITWRNEKMNSENRMPIDEGLASHVYSPTCNVKP